MSSDMAVDEMTTAEIVAAVDEHEAQRGVGERVVLRGVQVIVLDELNDEDRAHVMGFPTSEAWIAEGMAPGSFDAAVEAHAGKSGEEGNVPGRYRAVKKAAWLEKGPRVIEPPIA